MARLHITWRSHSENQEIWHRQSSIINMWLIIIRVLRKQEHQRITSIKNNRMKIISGFTKDIGFMPVSFFEWLLYKYECVEAMNYS